VNQGPQPFCQKKNKPENDYGQNEPKDFDLVDPPITLKLTSLSNVLGPSPISTRIANIFQETAMC
jgi:hypothetical protein